MCAQKIIMETQSRTMGKAKENKEGDTKVSEMVHTMP